MDEFSDVVNCVDYTDEYTLFSDFSSAVGLSPAPSDALGVHRLFFKGLNKGSILPTLEPFSRPFIRVPGGEWEHVVGLGCESWPDRWVQTGATTNYEVSQVVRFLDAERIRIEWEISPRTDESGPPEFGILGAIYPGQAALISGQLRSSFAEFKIRKSFNNSFLKQAADIVSVFGWEFEGEREMAGGFRGDIPIPSLPPESGGWRTDVSASESATWWFSTSPSPTSRGWRISLNIHVAFETDEGRERREVCGTPPAYFDYGSLPETRPNTLYWNRKLRQALVTILGASVRHPGYGAFSEHTAFLASVSNWSSTLWFWDHFIAAVAVGAFRPEMMTSGVKCLLRHTEGERIAPGILLAFPPYGAKDHMRDCYAPIASWAVLKAWTVEGRRPDLESIYPMLCEHHEGWFRHCDRDGDGIPEWRNAGNPSDDSPRFDPYAPYPGAACFDLPPFPSADLCAYLLLDARCLAHFAEVLGFGSELLYWQERADFLRKHLQERHWDEEELFFYDLTPQGEKMKIKTFFGLLPLWADPDLLPAETARAAIRRHLLNPSEFWGDIPFPSVAYDEPTYDPVGYWRGRTWGHVYYWNTEILSLHGFVEEAEEARHRYLRVAAAHKESMENFPSDPALLHEKSVRSYTWCGAVTVYFLLDWHRRPVQSLLAPAIPCVEVS